MKSTPNQATLPLESSKRDSLPRSGNGEHKLNRTATATNGTPAPAVKAQISPRDVKLRAGEAMTLTSPISREQPGLKAQPAAPWLNPTQLERPAFLLNFPFSYATESPNNPWMTDLTPDERQPDFKRASVQFLEVYRSIAAEALVYLLPTPR